MKLNGKPVRLSKERYPDGDKRKTLPIEVENEWHRITREGIPTETHLADVFERFKQTCTPGHHLKNVTYQLGMFLSFVGKEMKAEKLRPFHLSDYLKTKKTWGPSTQRTCVNRILAALNYAVREGLLTQNPVSSVPGYKRQGYWMRRKGVVSPELRAALEAKARPAFRAFLVALRECGARPVEIRRARIEKCDLDAGILLVPNKTARKTGQAERAIYLTEEMKTLIKQRIGDRKEGYIFLTEQGKNWSYDNLEERWRVLKNKVGVPKGISLYSYRRSFASTAINQKNINPALVAQLLGHAGLDIMMRHYLETDPVALKKAVEEATRQIEDKSKADNA